MMITDQMAKALAGILTAASLPHSPTVQAGISTVENDEESMRVIVVGMVGKLYKELLPGIYDVSGEVVIRQHASDANAESNYRQTCEAVRHVLFAKYSIPTQIHAEDQKLTVYRWIPGDQESFSNGTLLGARFTWTARARQDPHNSN